MKRNFVSCVSSMEACDKCGGSVYYEHIEGEEEYFCFSCGSSYELTYERDTSGEPVYKAQVIDTPTDVLMQIWDFVDENEAVVYQKPVSPDTTSEMLMAFLNEHDNLPQGERILSLKGRPLNNVYEDIKVVLEAGKLTIMQPELIEEERDGFGVLCRIAEGNVKDLTSIGKGSKEEALRKMKEEALPVEYLTWWNETTESIEVLYGEVAM